MEQTSTNGHDTSAARIGRQHEDGQTAWLSEMDVEDEVAQTRSGSTSQLFSLLSACLAEKISLSAECPVNQTRAENKTSPRANKPVTRQQTVSEFHVQEIEHSPALHLYSIRHLVRSTTREEPSRSENSSKELFDWPRPSERYQSTVARVPSLRQAKDYRLSSLSRLQPTTPLHLESHTPRETQPYGAPPSRVSALQHHRRATGP